MLIGFGLLIPITVSAQCPFEKSSRSETYIPPEKPGDIWVVLKTEGVAPIVNVHWGTYKKSKVLLGHYGYSAFKLKHINADKVPLTLSVEHCTIAYIKQGSQPKCKGRKTKVFTF